jgi:hypothetical protein
MLMPSCFATHFSQWMVPMTERNFHAKWPHVIIYTMHFIHELMPELLLVAFIGVIIGIIFFVRYCIRVFFKSAK